MTNFENWALRHAVGHFMDVYEGVTHGQVMQALTDWVQDGGLLAETALCDLADLYSGHEDLTCDEMVEDITAMQMWIMGLAGEALEAARASALEDSVLGILDVKEADMKELAGRNLT